MIAIGAALGGLGLACMLVRKSLLGLLIGCQLLILGGTATFVLAGVSAGVPVKGHVFALFIVLGGVSQLAAGYALAVRLFYLRRNAGLEELRNLRR